MLDVLYSNQAEKWLKRAQKGIMQRVMEKIQELRKNPNPRGSVKVKGFDNLHRVRVGDYRILYEVDRSNKVLGIAKIDKRDRVY